MKEEDGEERSEGGYGGEWVAVMLMHTYECLRYERRARGSDDDDSPRRNGGRKRATSVLLHPPPRYIVVRTPSK